MAIKLNELPSIKASSTPTGSGEVKALDAGGLPFPNVGAPTTGTDAINRDYLEANAAPLLWDEVRNFDINIQALFDTPIAETITFGGINLIYEESTQQIAIDVSNYQGINNALVVSQTIFTLTTTGGFRKLAGSNTITPSAQNIQYFSAFPTDVPTPLVPLDNFYRFSIANTTGGDYWWMWVRLSDSGPDGVDVVFKMEVWRNNDQSSSKEVQITSNYTRIR